VVGNTKFSDGRHHDLAKKNPQACMACHGAQGQGTVLSRAAMDRTLQAKEDNKTIQLAKGQPVDCGLCHKNPYIRR
jgi:cytochrome c553